MKKEYRDMIECTGHGFWEWNPISNALYFSKQWQEMLGYEDKELVHGIEEWVSRIHPDDFSHCFNALATLLRGTISVYRNEHRMLCKDGKYRWFLDQARVLERNPQGYPSKVIGTYTDIDELKSSLEYYQKSNAQKER